jgi:hypothetical protein
MGYDITACLLVLVLLHMLSLNQSYPMLFRTTMKALGDLSVNNMQS